MTREPEVHFLTTLRKMKAVWLLPVLPCLMFGQDTLKIMSYNLLNYGASDASRDGYYRTVLRYARPDVLAVEEITTQADVDSFYNRVVNVVFPGQFSKGAFVYRSGDTNQEVYYRTTKFTFVANIPIHTDLRDINEFSLYNAIAGDTLRVYVAHLKASSGSANEAERAREVDSLRRVTNALGSGKYFVVLGDFNIYGSTEQAYQKLLQTSPGDDGRFIDTIHMSGTWNNSLYAPFHTQSTRTRSFGGGATGGLDDRFDLMLYSRAIATGDGRISYAGNSMTPLGNDGNHFNDSINRMPNTAVPDSVANALHYASDHLPVSARFVFRDLIVPIQLTYFHGSVLGLQGIVQLSWGTLSEINNYGFEVQRRSDRQTAFSTLTFIPGHGTTNVPQHYLCNDSSASAGVWWYRLNQIDLDGTAHLTDPMRIDVLTGVTGQEPAEFALYQNYPNPFNPSTTISFSTVRPGQVTLKVYDVLGREVATLVHGLLDGGYHTVRWEADVAAGVYFYRLSVAPSARGDLVRSRKLILAK